MSLLSYSTYNSTISDSVFVTASTLASLLWAAIDRVRGKNSGRIFTTQTRPFSLETSMLRTPIDQIRKSELKTRKSFRKLAFDLTSKYNVNNEEIPQILLVDSVPVVHHTLPDPARWKEIDSRQKEQEKIFFNHPSLYLRTFENLSRKTKKRRISNTNLLKLRLQRSSRKRRSINTTPHLEGILRRRQLYCRTGYHIQILPNGRISSTTKDHNKYAILDFISVGVGLVSIRGVESGKYLSMDNRGRLYGSNVRTKESTFKETLQENWYNTYSASRFRNKGTRQCYIAFNRSGRWRHGCRSNANQRITQFLPRPVDPEKVPELYKGILY